MEVFIHAMFIGMLPILDDEFVPNRMKKSQKRLFYVTLAHY